MPPSEREKHDQYIKRYLKTGESKCVGKGAREVTARHRFGKPLMLELTVSELIEDGEPIFIGAMRDVSERKNILKN